jgi:hypothetical protein
MGGHFAKRDNMEYTLEEFYDLATKEFGDKFTIKSIQITDENLDKFNGEHNCHVTKEEIEDYKQVWLLENKCPKCDADLFGFFGTFTWGLAHGYGYCEGCNTVSFKYYHYIGDCKTPLQALSLSGF